VDELSRIQTQISPSKPTVANTKAQDELMKRIMEMSGFTSLGEKPKLTQEILDKIVTNTFPPRESITKEAFMHAFNRMHMVESIQILYDDAPEISFRIELASDFLLGHGSDQFRSTFKTLKAKYMIEGYTKLEFTFTCKEVIE
jgi:hypothetical protein